MACDAAIAAGLDRHSTLDARMRVDRLALAKRNVAVHRAESDSAALARHEGCAALVTNERATGKASPSVRRTLKRVAAPLARLADTTVGERRAHARQQVWVNAPESVVRLRIAAAAVDDEVRKPIGFLMPSEDAKRHDVVDREVLRCAASLADPSVAGVARPPRYRPRRATVTLVTAPPSGVVCTEQSAVTHPPILPEGVDGCPRIS